MSLQSRLRAVALASCALSVLAAPPAHAQARREYRINGGDLSGALRQFSVQSDQEILFDSSLVARKRISGFTGTGTAAGALGRLLSNSGLTCAPSVRSPVLSTPRLSAPSGRAIAAASRAAAPATGIGAAAIEQR
jgi:hypothetical protein